MYLFLFITYIYVMCCNIFIFCDIRSMRVRVCKTNKRCVHISQHSAR